MNETGAGSATPSDIRGGVLVLGRRRPGFDRQWGGRMLTEALDALKSTGLVTGLQPQTAGDPAALDDAVSALRSAGCNVLVVLQQTMGDGRLGPLLAQAWDGPIVLWATPERPDGDKVSACSLVGQHNVAAALQRLDAPFELVAGSPDDPAVGAEVARRVCIAHAACRLRGATAGLIGYHAPGFVDMHADPFDLNRTLGVQLHHLGLTEFFQAVRNQPDDRIDEDLTEVERLGLPAEGVGRDDLRTASRFYLAIRDVFAAERLDALAIRDWPEMPAEFDQWPYLALARLAGEDVPVAVEGDVYGALSRLVGVALGAGAGFLTDWLAHDAGTITFWHAGEAPLNMCEPSGGDRGARLGRHFNNDKPVVVNADLAADRPVTILRLWHADGGLCMTGVEGQTVPPRRPLLGTNGLVAVDDRDVGEWFDELVHAGMPHHPLLLPGRHADSLRRLARMLHATWIG